MVKYFSQAELWGLYLLLDWVLYATCLFDSLHVILPVFVKKYNSFYLKKGCYVERYVTSRSACFLQKKRKPRDGSSIIDNKSAAILKLRSGGRWVNRLLPVIYITRICPSLSGSFASLIGLYLDLEDVDEVYMKDGSGSCTMQPCTHNNKTSQYQVEARRSDSFHFFYNTMFL